MHEICEQGGVTSSRVFFFSCVASASERLSFASSGNFCTMLREHLYLSVLTMNVPPMTLNKASNAFYSSLSTSRKGSSSCQSVPVRAIFEAPPWTPSAPLSIGQLNMSTLLKRFEHKLIYFTYRCTHSLCSFTTVRCQ